MRLYSFARYFSSVSIKVNNRKLLQSAVFQHPYHYQQQSFLQLCQKRPFKTSASNKAIPPVILILFTRVAKVGAMITGRLFRNWWRKLPDERRIKYKGYLKSNRLIVGGAFGGIGLGLFIYYDSHTQENPLTHRKTFVAFNEEQFNEIAKQELNILLMANKDKIVPADIKNPHYRRVADVAQRLLNANKDLEIIRKKNWTITLVDESERNAFVLPCGSIFVFRGMLDFCDNDDQLGVVLGHEMAHCVLGHGAEQASLLHIMDLIFVIPLAILWAVLGDAAALLVQWISGSIAQILMSLPYSRICETEGDEIGVILAAKACFDVREAPILWKKMALINEVGGEMEIEWLSTHPSNENRQSQLEKVLPHALSVRSTCKCPKLKHFDSYKILEEFEKKIAKERKNKVDENLAISLKLP